ncbi:MAG: M23 family metallopeptidase [Anaerolineae bacterium]|nr:M23 family metallopeptidase [Anaerolineae bacterium]
MTEPKNPIDPPNSQPSPRESGERKPSLIWDRLSRFGLAEPVLRYGIHILTIALVLLALLLMRSFSTAMQSEHRAELAATAQVIAAPTIEAAVEEISGYGGSLFSGGIPIFPEPEVVLAAGIPRYAQIETTIPTRSRVGVSTYIVQAGDNLFSIADNYGIAPESVLWGNPYTLNGDLRYISPGQELTILPVDGVYHRWSSGETLSGVARFYGVEPRAIIEWPGNKLDSYEVDPDTLELDDGTWLIIPGGQKELVDWGPPAITRQNPAVAAYYGSGSCGSVYEGAIGTGTFIWPTTNPSLSGYTYDPGLHPAIDIGGPEGAPIFASDGGVIVYAGWSDYGYGNLVVIDHGTGWQTAYAHMLSFNVACGQSVYQGDVIGAVGNTGNSSGAHLHFEMTSELYGKVNPLDWVSP